MPAARVGSRVAAEGAVKDPQRHALLSMPPPLKPAELPLSVLLLTVIGCPPCGEDGTAVCGGGRVAAEGAVNYRQCPKVVDGATPVNGGVAAQGAVGNSQRRVALPSL